jgi:hypothetical protein
MDIHKTNDAWIFHIKKIKKQFMWIYVIHVVYNEV